MIGMIGKDKEGLEGWEGIEPCHNHFPMFFFQSFESKIFH